MHVFSHGLRISIVTLWLLSLGFLAPSLMHADEYWRGWCAGRTAGLLHARNYIDAVLPPLREGLASEQETCAEKFDLFLQAVPLYYFGPPFSQPFTVKHEDGLEIACPSGEIIKPALEQKKG